MTTRNIATTTRRIVLALGVATAAVVAIPSTQAAHAAGAKPNFVAPSGWHIHSAAPSAGWRSVKPTTRWTHMSPQSKWTHMSPQSKWTHMSPQSKWYSVTPDRWSWNGVAPSARWHSIKPQG